MSRSNRRSFLKTPAIAAVALNEISPRIWHEEAYFQPKYSGDAGRIVAEPERGAGQRWKDFPFVNRRLF